MLRNSRLIFFAVIAALLLALVPLVALAQGPDNQEEGLLLRVNGPVTVGAQEVIDNVVVINDNVTILGTVTGTLVVVNGNATISGTVGEDVTVFNGTLSVEGSGTVRDVILIRGNLVEDSGSTITGTITQRDRVTINLWDWGFFWMLMWVGITTAFVVAGLVFAGAGARQLKSAASAMGNDLGPSLLSTFAVWIVLPVLMVLVLFSIVGIPLGIGYFLFIMPIVWFLGYLVAGAQLGRMLIASQRDAERPYLAVAVGILILQAIGLFPILGGFITFLAGMVGSGALVYVAWRAWRGPDTVEPAPQPVTTQLTAPAAGD